MQILIKIICFLYFHTTSCILYFDSFFSFKGASLTEEPDRRQSVRSLRVGHDWAIHFHFSLSCIGGGNGNPLQYSCLENPRDRGAWWAAVHGVAQSRTRLKWLSSSSNVGDLGLIPESRRSLGEGNGNWL